MIVTAEKRVNVGIPAMSTLYLPRKFLVGIASLMWILVAPTGMMKI